MYRAIATHKPAKELYCAKLVAEGERPGLPATVPMENPYRGCKLQRHGIAQACRGLQLQSLWRIPTAAVS